MNKITNFNDISDVRDLKNYLINKQNSNMQLYHYTSIESLIHIITNRSIRITRYDLLNDKAEMKLINNTGKDVDYIMSFSNNVREYVSMWQMYGDSKGIKVRIGFPESIFKKDINDSFYLDANKTKKIDIFSEDFIGISKKNYLISDVVYLDNDKNEFRYNTRSIRNVIVDDRTIKELSGFVKFDCWEFEKERRLKVRISGIDLNPNYIFANISEELINNMSVTFNPWISDNFKNGLINMLNTIAGYELNYFDSKHKGEIL